MNNIPLYMGVLLIIPVKEQVAGPQNLPHGFGVGAVMTTDLAIRHESIKDNIRQQALLYSTHQATQAIENIINNIRYVSIENTWYSIIREVSKVSLLSKAIAGAVVTAFATPDLSGGTAKASSQSGCEMALIVERYQPF